MLVVLLGAPERDLFLAKIGAARHIRVGAPTLVETAIVLGRRWSLDAERHVTGFLDQAGGLVVSFERPHWLAAATAWSTFGKGRHPAQLNFGDCLAYATAKVAGEPLLSKGDGFARTDLELA
jgi:ribonuclease VapC